MPVPFQSASSKLDLSYAPINPAWIREGAPIARAAELSRSADETAFTVVWACTPGKFDWTYHLDETITILEGSIVLSDVGNPPRRLGPGDVVFFPKGSQVAWEVEGYVKKVACFRRVLPNPLLDAFRILRRLKTALKRGAPAVGDVMGGLPAAR